MTFLDKIRDHIGRNKASLEYRAASFVWCNYAQVRSIFNRLHNHVVMRLPDERFYFYKNRHWWRAGRRFASRGEYKCVKRHLGDLPAAVPGRLKIGLIARSSTTHFVDPLLASLGDGCELFYYPAYDRGLFRDIAELDIVWLEWGSAAFLLPALAARKGPGTQIVCRIHDHELRQASHMENAAWGAADYLVFINRDSMADFERLTSGRFVDKQRFVANAVNEKSFPLRRGAYGKTVLLLSEGFTPRKNHLRAVELFALAQAQVEDLHLLIRADPDFEGSDPTPVFARIRALGLEERVTFLMPRGDRVARKLAYVAKTDIVEVYHHADAVFSTSDHEGFHYAVAEAMLCGLFPLVWDWRWGRARDFWDPYVAADANDFVERLVGWGKSDAEERRQAGAQARAYCVERFGQAATRQSLGKVFPQIRQTEQSSPKRLILFAHNHLYRFDPHGGEKSMARIVEYLCDCGYEILVVVRNLKNREYKRERFGRVTVICVPASVYRNTVLDILHWWRPQAAMVWELPAREIWDICVGKGIPYVLFIRYWHLINPPPYRDMLSDSIDDEFRKKHAPIFHNASSVVVNAKHVGQVIQRFYGVASTVAYVPVERLGRTAADAAKHYITLVNARKSNGGRLVRALAQRLPDVDFLVVDANDGGDYPSNVVCRGYSAGPYNELMRDTRILLFPFDDEPCGTGRVVIEAYNLGIPVMGPAKGGLPEVILREHLIADNDAIDQWAEKLMEIEATYDDSVARVMEIAQSYDEERELKVVRREIEQSMSKGVRQDTMGFSEPSDDAYRMAKTDECGDQVIGDYRFVRCPHPATGSG
ncbi:MAG: hypothetical protein A2289_25890 [Deltaproteobacteria bacterium RIFOXYA12_FULL_58_15]|nr:MAG: hypothetical protein A2289_25890 [Deltaproteobacteria bacterium RIFOXYA12_FULL_58_15]